ncbi:MAG: SpoIID/LytB domain-containing protein [Bacillota bacterium]|jgi:stage II sporulation protein D|uniref:SpoIID/LytB domain-containing protein n=1 Tax=Thermanaerosceptrum fracticalcis TaxID=1712410 RepID=A0A7G6E5M3_THEFR|nr:SpoIID/LytB domain-containing protein [Thermanaerosceptrum fracticalcis]QNB47377.1 SpoIID/LytB domain-containing protein [Thermanaerosceptrum fracticalcis]
MRKNTIGVLLFLCILSLSLVVTGCPGPQRKPPQQPRGKEPTISLYINETGEKKQIAIEEYLKGVVAAEMEPTWPVEALAAQAILARTFTLERIKKMGGVPARGTDASTSVEEFQAYDPKRINDNVSRAVEMTRGEVAKYQGRYIKAWFFADAGGQTAASAEEGLAYTKEPTPYVQSVKDPGFAITKEENKAWRAEFPLSVVRDSVKQAAGQDPGQITRATITKKGPSGRAMTIQLGNVSVSGPALRLALGSEKMRSTLLTDLKVTGNKLIVSGKGFGHGVGMSQWGAKALAEQGKSPEDIIRYFFKDIEIVKEWQ